MGTGRPGAGLSPISSLRRRPESRSWLLLSALALAALLSACSQPGPSEGTIFEDPKPAPLFSLVNQFGDPVDLEAFRGRVAVLTFLYTSCPDICPVVTTHLRDVREMLGDDAHEVGIIAVSVDPDRDSVQQAHDYSDRWRMVDKWSFLVGKEADLQPVWAAYYIDPAQVGPTATQEAPRGNSSTGSGGVSALAKDIAEAYTITHSAPVYLIDREGLLRGLHTLPFEPEALVKDIRALLR